MQIRTSTGSYILVPKDSTGGVFTYGNAGEGFNSWRPRSLITDTIKGALEDVLEDIAALSSDEYLQSIEEARNDYQTGKVKRLDDIFEV